MKIDPLEIEKWVTKYSNSNYFEPPPSKWLVIPHPNVNDHLDVDIRGITGGQATGGEIAVGKTFKPKRVWRYIATYIANDFIYELGIYYICVERHYPYEESTWLVYNMHIYNNYVQVTNGEKLDSSEKLKLNFISDHITWSRLPTKDCTEIKFTMRHDDYKDTHNGSAVTDLKKLITIYENAIIGKHLQLI